MTVLGVAAVPVRLATLLTGFQADPPSLLADALLVGVLLLYLLGVLRLTRRGRRWPVATTASFCGGLLLVFVAVGSGLAAYDDDNFSAHVVQHVVLMMVAPPLLVLGRPVTLFLQSSPRRLQSAGARLVRSDVVAHLTGAGIMVAYFGFMWVYFLTPLYRWSIDSQPLHDGVHVVCVLLGMCYWQFVLAPERLPRQSPHLRRILAILVGMPLEMYLGFVLHGLGRPIGPGTTAASVEAGGDVFWWLTMLVSGVALAVALGQWMRDDERAARRLDAVALREGETEWPFEPYLNSATDPPSGAGQGGIWRG